MSTALLVLAGGAIGAPARYLTDRWVQSRHSVRFPAGTLVVNLVGSFLLGVVAGGVASAGWSPHLLAFAGTGFCGGFTTFSTFAVEGVDLARDGHRLRSVGYVVLSAAAGVALAQLGWLLH
jgi:CrcB protein